MAWEDPDTPKVMTAAEVKAAISPVSVLEAFGIDVPFSGKINSPWNQADHTPSCHVYDDHVYDFSTGQGGDVIDLTMALTDKDFRDAKRWLSQLIQFNGPELVEVKKQSEKPLKFFTEDYRAITNSWTVAMQEMVRTRWGISPAELLEVADVRAVQDTLYIPHWFEGEVVGVKVRRTSGEKTAIPGSNFSKRLYSGGLHASRFGEKAACAVLVEGEPDAWVMSLMPDQYNQRSVYALPAGAGVWKDEWADALLDKHDEVWVCMDNDSAGEKAREKITRSLKWNCKQLMVPALYNDVADAYKAGWRWPQQQRAADHKVCAVCGVDQLLSNFYANSKAGDGHYNKCKPCHNAERRENERQRWGRP